MENMSYCPLFNRIELTTNDNAGFKACWHLEPDILNEKMNEAGFLLDSPNLVLRLFESDDQLRHHDINVSKTKGCLSLFLQPQRAYYVSIGIKTAEQFIPILSSNTVMKYM